MATTDTPGWVSNSSLASRISALLDGWNKYKNALRDLLTKPSGTVDMEDGNGEIVTLPSMPELQSQVDAMLSSGSGAVASAQASASSAAASASESNGYAQESLTHAQEAQGYSDEGLTHATAAAASAQAASDSEATVDASAAAAAASKDDAAASAASADSAATRAGASASAAAASDSSSATSASNAASSAAEAQAWALTAQTTVTGLLHYMGSWDASGGSFPPSPTTGDFWKIGTAGTLDGKDMAVGDQIIYSGTGWDKIDNTESVTSVAGMVGAVNLSISNIGGLEGALAGKFSTGGGTVSGDVSATGNVIAKGGLLLIGNNNQGLLNGYSDTNGVNWLRIRAEASLWGAPNRELLIGSDGTFNFDTKPIWHAGNLNPSSMVSRAPGYAVADANALSGVGGTALNSSAANTPTGDWATVMQVAPFEGNDRAFQLGFSWNQPGPLYFRNQYGSNTWGSWKKLVDTSGALFIGELSVSGAALRAYNWGGVSTDGVLYMSAGDSWIFKNGGKYRFKNAEGGGWIAELVSGGTIWTSDNFNPASKSDTSHSHTNIGRLVDGQPMGANTASTITDWNAATTNGWYMASNAANAPTTAWYIGQVTIHNGSWITQEVWDFTNGANPQPRWVRNMLSGTWGAWYRIDTVKTWVQSGDPGSAAKDGDLWVW